MAAGGLRATVRPRVGLRALSVTGAARGAGRGRMGRFTCCMEGEIPRHPHLRSVGHRQPAGGRALAIGCFLKISFENLFCFLKTFC